MDVVIYGLGDFASLIHHYIRRENSCRVVAFCADKEYLLRTSVDGLPVVSFECVETLYPPDRFRMFVVAGYGSMRARKRMFSSARGKGYELFSYVSRDAIRDESNVIGENCAVLPGVVLEPFAAIGANTFVNSAAVVCHHARIGEHCFIAARSVVGGYTSIGEGSFVGFGATVLQKLSLGRETLVGAMSLVDGNTEDHATYYGIPARLRGRHAERGIEIVDSGR